ncbi:hypothetical protein NC652_040294 [Populus alba x Populus x berolinensis]|nr:hypothetical protein NC652_040294 [Populus alba x Populus x berolinensis]
MKKSLMLLLLSKFLKTCLKIISHQESQWNRMSLPSLLLVNHLGEPMFLP